MMNHHAHSHSRQIQRCTGLVFAASTVFTSIGLAQGSISAGGADPYSRYMFPGQCAGTLHRMEKRFWRDKPDTSFFGPRGRAAQVTSIAAVRQCVSRFNVARTSEKDLLPLGSAYLAANQDELAEQAFQRLIEVQASKPVADRAWAMAQIVDICVHASPFRVEMARRYMAKLDALGPGAAAASRRIAHLEIFKVAQFGDDLKTMEEEGARAIASGKEISVDSVRKQRRGEAYQSYSSVAYLRMRQRDTIALIALGDSAIKDLRGGDPASKADIVPVLQAYRLLGKPAPRLQAARWINDGNKGVYPMKAPAPVSVVAFLLTNCFDRCYSTYSIVKRLKQDHGTSLSAVGAMRTAGYYGNSLLTPDREISIYERYFTDRVRLPATVGISTTDFNHIDDGRIRAKADPNDESYDPDFDRYPVPVFLVDRNGNVRYIAAMTPKYEMALRNIVAEERNGAAARAAAE